MQRKKFKTFNSDSSTKQKEEYAKCAAIGDMLIKYIDHPNFPRANCYIVVGEDLVVDVFEPTRKYSIMNLLWCWEKDRTEVYRGKK